MQQTLKLSFITYVYGRIQDGQTAKVTFRTPINEAYPETVGTVGITAGEALDETRFNDIVSVLNRLAADSGYEFGPAKYIRDGFGFTQYKDTFIHAKNIVGADDYSFEELTAYNHDFMMKTTQGKKGLCAAWACPIFRLDEKSEKILNGFFAQALDYYVQEAAKSKICKQAYDAAEARKEAELRARLQRFPAFKITKNYHSSYYGGKQELEFEFTENLSQERFEEFLEAYGLKTKAKPCYAPITPERVEFGGFGRKFWYSWHGEWTD